MAGSKYTIIVADLLSGVVRDEIPFDTFSYAHVLNAAGSFSGTISIDHPKATRSNLDPSRTAVYVLRDGVCVWSGILWTVQADVGQQNQVQVGAEGWFSYFYGPGGQTSRGRFIKDDVRIAADPCLLAQALIEDAQAPLGAQLGIVTGDSEYGPNFVDITWQSVERTNVGQAILDVAESAAGFDFSFDTDVTSGTPVTSFRTWYPMQGRRNTGLVFELGANVTQLTEMVDGTVQANSVDVIGQGIDATTLIGSAIDTSQFTAYPLLETVQQSKSQTGSSQAVLDLEAQSWLAALTLPVDNLPNIAVRVTPDMAPGVWTMGDFCTVIARRGFLDLAETYRIIGDQITVDAQGGETVAITFATAASFL